MQFYHVIIIIKFKYLFKKKQIFKLHNFENFVLNCEIKSLNDNPDHEL